MRKVKIKFPKVASKIRLSKDGVEKRIALAASGAFAKAREQAFRANQPVMVVADGNLVQISPKGDRKVVGTVKAPSGGVKINVQKDVAISVSWTTSHD